MAEHFKITWSAIEPIWEENKMINVRCSQKLSASITNKAQRIFLKELEHYGSNYPEDWGETIYTLCFTEDLIRKWEALPYGSMAVTNKFIFQGIETSENNSETQNFRQERPFFIQMKTERPWPSFVSDESIHQIGQPAIRSIPPEFIHLEQHSYNPDKVLLKEEHLPKNQMTEKFIEDFKKYISVINKIRDNKKEFLNLLCDLLNSSSTLNPMLAQWPALWELFPPYLRQRLGSLPQRTQVRTPIPIESIKRMDAIYMTTKFFKTKDQE